ncbi:MAG: hemerythrin domain-containing protein [Bdellovibrionaceae bacterium]|nr:hemerythrin domain-containing protein [Bdellovibrionales bacterium]MCB9083154.1 hemerythrin domain-containing protein [Pseudobdellovibrionaceae bacterium]
MPSPLVNQLKSEHRKIQEVFQKIREVGGSSPEGRALLFEAKDLILSHIKTEDEHIYPSLARSAEGREVAEGFAREMGNLSQAIIDFFAKYEKGDESAIQFAVDLGRVMGAMSTRIIREESRLYEAYDRMVANRMTA